MYGSLADSIDIGSVRLTERFLHTDPPTADQVSALRHHVDEALDALPSYAVDLRRARTVVVVSGTGLTVAAGVLGLEGALDSALFAAGSESLPHAARTATRAVATATVPTRTVDRLILRL